LFTLVAAVRPLAPASCKRRGGEKEKKSQHVENSRNPLVKRKPMIQSQKAMMQMEGGGGGKESQHVENSWNLFVKRKPITQSLKAMMQMEGGRKKRKASMLKIAVTSL
jgi:hypothetical protein